MSYAIIQEYSKEYFQPKLGRKIKIFSLGRKNNILLKGKECVQFRSCTFVYAYAVVVLMHASLYVDCESIYTSSYGSEYNKFKQSKLCEKYINPVPLLYRC